MRVTAFLSDAERSSVVVEALRYSRKVVGSRTNEVNDLYQFT
jgi:hypothetical protein